MPLRGGGQWGRREERGLRFGLQPTTWARGRCNGRRQARKREAGPTVQCRCVSGQGQAAEPAGLGPWCPGRGTRPDWWSSGGYLSRWRKTGRQLWPDVHPGRSHPPTDAVRGLLQIQDRCVGSPVLVCHCCRLGHVRVQGPRSPPLQAVARDDDGVRRVADRCLQAGEFVV